MTNPTKSEVRRFTILARDIGCMACKREGRFRFGDIHHLVKTYRLGHAFSVPLCEWHHRGIKLRPGMSIEFNTVGYGPSLAHNKRAFVERYGTELELLEKTNKLLAQVEANIVGRAT